MSSHTPIRFNTTPLSTSFFKSKSIFLDEWWLLKPQNQCKGLAVGGVASMERDRVFLSTVIAKRHEANVVETEDGITIVFRGFINASHTSQNGFSSEVCQQFLVGFPHDWKHYSAHSSGNACEHVDSVTCFDDSNVSSHKKTADEISQEAMEAEDNGNIASHELSEPQFDIICCENGVSDILELNASFPKKTTAETSHVAMTAEDNSNVSQQQVDVIYKGEKGVSDVATTESSQSLTGVLDPVSCARLLEKSSFKSPLPIKKLEFDQLSGDGKEKRRVKRKIVDKVMCFSSPVRRSPRLHNCKKMR
uniref:Kinetochore-associated protein KNL-2 homolog n=1 Tax=Cicer arietinum TaxID=3827 RepID=A0A1S2XIY4_CICAR|nr:kinetochore-associated protein KNL-2 homolog [Cicer arietinum]